MNIAAVIFDFDYTLADSSPGIVACTNHTLAAMGLPPAPEDVICRAIGLSLPASFPQYADPSHAHRAGEFQTHFVERADQIMVDHTALLPAVPETIARLKADGLRLGIVTTKFRYRIEAVLTRDGLADSFEVIVGYEDVPEPKPDPHGLRLALERLGVVPEQALYVGDSVTDARTAQNAGVPFVAVLSGTTPAADFAPYRPAAVLETVAALPGWRESR